jgi:hypothetical protein
MNKSSSIATFWAACLLLAGDSAKLCGMRFLILALLLLAANAQGSSISGEYSVSGVSQSGTKYTGKATIRQRGQVYVVGWTLLGGTIYRGTGVLQNNHFAVMWTPCGVSSYTIQGKTLKGIWAGCEDSKTGTETLTKK